LDALKKPERVRKKKKSTQTKPISLAMTRKGKKKTARKAVPEHRRRGGGKTRPYQVHEKKTGPLALSYDVKGGREEKGSKSC